jgi:uncharacterized protein YqeY
MVERQLDQDLKTAMLAGDTQRVTVLRSLKTAITYARVAGKSKVDSLPEQEILQLFAKEAKKRQEGADGFLQAGNRARANEELTEKAIIEAYLPPALSEEEVAKIVDDVIAQLDERNPKAMGQVIAVVKEKVGSRAEGALVARLVKERLQS